MAELNEIISKAIEISREVVAKEAFNSDRNGLWVKDSMKALSESKLTGLVVPTEQNGMGQGLFALARVCEELGKSYASTGLCFGMHCVGSAVLAAKASKWQKEKYLEPIAAGQHITTLALSEPGTGSHFYYPQTSLRQAGSEIAINGTKAFVTNGAHADSYVISTKGTTEQKDPDQFTCIVIDAETRGMEWQEEWTGFGMRGNSSRTLLLKNIRVQKQQILGAEGDQLWYIFNVMAPNFLIAMSGTYLGLAQTALDIATENLKNRVYMHNGQRLSQNTILQHRLGTMWAKVESARRMVYNGAIAGDNMEAGGLPAILAAKAEVARCAVTIVNEAMTLTGGIGYQQNSMLAMLLRDARASHIMSPTTDLLYTWLGRSLLDQPLLSD